MKPLTFAILVLALLAVVVAGFFLLARDAPGPAPPRSVSVEAWLPEADGDPTLIRRADGSYIFRIPLAGGETTDITPEEFARRLYDAGTRGAWWQRVMNITSPIGIAWVVMGLVGQLMFTGRMLVQWLVSERAKKSVVPTAFWWMSLVGASMLLTYFIWRKDVVGVLGQATGWIIYIRNLWLIHRGDRAPSVSDDADAEPALDPVVTTRDE